MFNSNPSEISYTYWVRCIDPSKYSLYPNSDGKWMMFFHISEMDARWREACNLYNSGRLIGINSMKCSTASQNPFPQRLHGPDEGIIIFYCGPSEDKAKVMEYGKNILNNMRYNRPFFHYKSDKPHLINYAHQYKQLYTINTSEHYRSDGNNLYENQKLEKSSIKYENSKPKIWQNFNQSFNNASLVFPKFSTQIYKHNESYGFSDTRYQENNYVQRDA